MKSKPVKIKVNPSTEEQIKTAARKVFTQKGFAATRTRDIAEEAGINLALLNYYFRSKQKLFELIMMETMQEFLSSIKDILNDQKTSFEQKVEMIVSNYIDLLIKQPDIPLFILSELRNEPDVLVSKINGNEALMKSHFIFQYQQLVKEKTIVPNHPLHFIMNMLGMVVFPFIGSPMLKNLGGLKEEGFNELMMERKILIPKWINLILTTNRI